MWAFAVCLGNGKDYVAAAHQESLEKTRQAPLTYIRWLPDLRPRIANDLCTKFAVLLNPSRGIEIVPVLRGRSFHEHHVAIVLIQ